MNLVWLMRMAKWARNPPSPRQVKLALGVLLACLVLFGIEWAGYWPEALQVNRIPKP